MDKNKRYLLVIAILSVAAIAVWAVEPPTDFPGQGQGVPFANRGGEPNENPSGTSAVGIPTNHPGQGRGVPFANRNLCGDVDTSKCDDLVNQCESICAAKGAQAWTVNRNGVHEGEGGDSECAENTLIIDLNACNIFLEDGSKEVCMDVLCACYFC